MRTQGWAEAEKAKAQRNPAAMREHEQIFGQAPSSFFSSSLRLHGKNSWMFSGTLPPAAAQCSKYHVSHFRGFSFHLDNVAKIENNAAARALESQNS